MLDAIVHESPFVDLDYYRGMFGCRMRHATRKDGEGDVHEKGPCDEGAVESDTCCAAFGDAGGVDAAGSGNRRR